METFYLILAVLLQIKEPELIVANQQSASASVLKGGTMVHLPVGDGPHEAAISPNGKVGAISIYGVRGAPGNQIAIMDLTRDSVVRKISLGTYVRPHGMVFLSNNVIVATSEVTKNLVVVDVDKGVTDTIPTTQRGSHMVAVTADKKHAFTGNIGDASISELDLTTKQFVRTIAVPTQPEGITVLPNGSEVWVGSNNTGKVSVVDTKTGTITHTLEGMTFPYRLGASPDGKRVAIVDAEGNKLVVASVATHGVVGSIELTAPRGVSIAKDGRTAYVTLEAGTVAVVDLIDLKVLKTFSVQASPDGVATS